ncbi:glycosyltransferase family 2 protein [Rhodovulum adriaticum]|uniref:Glycosyl transferase family 2 n=1 Tax=Rhodovulum adriaticum TaxID=35804 RepID=A0A4R2NYN0_RHOAD|nr:glycosyltransferase [Rhodovulum adriaticum]MBK1634217.1 hypothetical protein [Rhodovulum adriaticum]TCP27232.1 glycosyl transferase family 2 [Rhodovulum adriaticum]
MTAAPSLAVGIPTYFRSADLLRLVKGLTAADPDLPVTVIDDGPDPATAEALADAGPRVRLIRHETNRGYAHSFAELIEGCSADYLLVSADDDLCDAAGLARSRALLTARRPDFAATQFLDRAGAIKRGQPAAGPVALADIRDASGHAPGLIYRVAAARRALPFLQARLAADCYAARIYPQTLLVYTMALQGAACTWLPAAPITEGAAHPPSLSDSDGTAYHSPAGRLREQAAFAQAFTALAGFVPAQAQDRLAAIATLHDQDAYRRFMRALRLHHPELVEDWISGSLFYCRNSLARHLLNLWSWRRARRRAERTLRKESR